ncbi:ceramide synthase 5-like [Polistes fuscatus]|uniref:ceramide synthase 5-like n=1 Tax=Polistes fuscatus TaxID=30207 RepID=UPI001CA8A82A|nr:ceramide synthase 5-like [Polistes fuscatus]
MTKDVIVRDYFENKQNSLWHLFFGLSLGIIVLYIRYIFIRFIFNLSRNYFRIREDIYVNVNVITEEDLQYMLIPVDRPDLNNLCEESWRFLCATCIFSYGLYILYDKPWVLDLKECYYDYPFHEVTNDMWWFHMLNVAYYWSRIIIHYFSTQKENFKELFFRNMVLLVYLHLAWYVNLVRLGILAMFGMAFSDIINEMKKALRLITYDIFWDFINIVLALIWVMARELVFPIRIVYTFFVAGSEILGSKNTPTILIMHLLLYLIFIMDFVHPGFHWTLY